MLFLMLSVALAGDLVIDTTVPIDIRTQGFPVANLAYPGRVRIPVPPGPMPLSIYIEGNPHFVALDIPVNDEVWVVVGKTGITSTRRATPVATGPSNVEFRSAGPGYLLVQIDGKRHKVGPNSPVSMELVGGEHEMKVRSVDGTVIWARGQLTLLGPGPVVVQLAEGVMPDIAGLGGSWQPAYSAQ